MKRPQIHEKALAAILEAMAGTCSPDGDLVLLAGDRPAPTSCSTLAGSTGTGAG